MTVRAKRNTRRRKSTRRRGSAKQSAHAPLPRIGLKGDIEIAVPQDWTIQAYDPALPAVLSTPAMIGMMEIAAGLAIQRHMPTGAISVGTRIEVDHLKAVPLGTFVRATARLVKHRGPFMVFDVEARAGKLVIGRGRVFRAIVEPGKFHAKALSQSAS